MVTCLPPENRLTGQEQEEGDGRSDTCEEDGEVAEAVGAVSWEQTGSVDM